MSYRCGAADWIDLAIGRLEDAKRSIGAGMGPSACDELRQARRCLNKARRRRESRRIGVRSEG